MRAIQVTCPQCGAALNVSGGKDDVTCEYCGASSAVQRRSRVFERVLPPPVNRPPELPIAVQHRSHVGRIIVLAILVAVGVGIFAIVRRVMKADMTWQGNGVPIQVDIDGDGKPELIGRSRSYSPDQITLVALDAATGATRWQSPVLGNYDDTYQGLLAAAGDVLVFASDRGKVTAFDRATGRVRWNASLPEQPKAFCDGGATALVIVTADDVPRGLRIADGQVTGDVPKTCAPLPTDATPDLEADFQEEQDLGLFAAKRIDLAGGGHLLFGQRAKGTGVPTLAQVGGWKVDVPSDPLSAGEGGPDIAAAGPALACASYKLKEFNSIPHISCFTLDRGTRVFDVSLAGNAPLEGMVVTDQIVLVSMWGALEARSTTTGRLLWEYGEAF